MWKNMKNITDTILVHANCKHTLLILQGHPCIQEFRTASCSCCLLEGNGHYDQNQLKVFPKGQEQDLAPGLHSSGIRSFCCFCYLLL